MTGFAKYDDIQGESFGGAMADTLVFDTAEEPAAASLKKVEIHYYCPAHDRAEAVPTDSFSINFAKIDYPPSTSGADISTEEISLGNAEVEWTY